MTDRNLFSPAHLRDQEQVAAGTVTNGRCAMKKVNCLGVLVVDALSSPLKDYPVPGRITQVLTDNLRFLPGGGAANSGRALAQLGIEVAVFSKLGADTNGRFIIDELQGCATVILKMGPRGCMVCNENGRTRLPSRATTVVDTTGAGDCFDAGFVAGLVNGMSPEQAATIGAEVAAICIRNVGGAVGIPKFEEL